MAHCPRNQFFDGFIRGQLKGCGKIELG